jgi:hypothetical protein
MKKIFFTILSLFALVASNAQCTPDSVTYKSPGIYPKSLPDAKANVVYSQVIQFKFPKDTTVSGLTGHIDSASITSIDGMPFSFAYHCSNKSCTYKGGQNGCVQITGNPKDSQIGSKTLKVNVLAYVTSSLLGHIQIPYSGNVGLNIVANSGLFYQSASTIKASQNFPNPFSTNTEIQFVSASHQSAYIKVSNELGQVVYSRALTANEGLNTFSFDRNSLPAGMYFYNLQMGNEMVARSMVIKD